MLPESLSETTRIDRDMINRLGPDPGSYILLLYSRKEQVVTVGRLGQLKTRSGYYLYVGSAFGPGGIKARLGHHSRVVAKFHWHIDYLRQHLALIECWYTDYPQRLERDWCEALSDHPDVSIPFKGFGASDDPGHAHLFYSAVRPELLHFKPALVSSEEGLKINVITDC